MTTSTTDKAGKSGPTPSMLASLLVFGVMIGLILLSVYLFGEDVASGPLQVSMTLATLFALAVALFYGFRGALISEAISHGVHATLGTVFVIFAIGAIIGALYLSGTVAAFVYYGIEVLNPKLFYIIAFVLASLLSLLIGSSFTTVGAIGVAFVGLASLMGVSPAITAGAAVSGAFLGDKVARISDTFILTTAVIGGVNADEHGRTVLRTAIPTWVISAILYLLLGFFGPVSGSPADPSQVQATIGQGFHVSILAFLPVVVIFVLSGLRVSAFISLMLAAISGVVLAGFTQSALIVRLADDPGLSYFQAVLKVGISTLGNGFSFNSGVAALDQLFSGGGTVAMLETAWLILIAAAFGAVVDYTGMVQRIIAPVIHWAKSGASLIVATSFSSIGLNALAADPYVSIVLAGRMFRDAYIQRNLKPVVLSTAIADSGTIFSPLVPWNVHGALVAAALGVSVVTYFPYAFLCYLSPIITMVMGYLYFRKDTLPQDVDANEVYGAEPEVLPESGLTA